MTSQKPALGRTIIENTLRRLPHIAGVQPHLDACVTRDVVPRLLQLSLFQNGPTTGYPATAMYDALAQILIHWEIEAGAPDTVAERLRKRAQRAPKAWVGD